MKLKNFLSYLVLTLLLITNFSGITKAATFTQTSNPQYSTSVNEGDVIEANKWNAVVYDISNIIADIASLKQYADDSIKNYFTDDWTNLSYSDKDVALGKNLEIGGKIETDILEIWAWKMTNGVITTNDIKDGSLKQEDLDPNIDYGQDIVFRKNWTVLYYDQWNIWIGENDPNEKLVVRNGSIKIKGTGNWIIFADWTKLTSLPTASNNNVLTEWDQTISWKKQFADGIALANYNTWNIFKFNSNPTYADNQYTTWHHMGYNTDESYFYVASTSWYAEFDTNVKRSWYTALKWHINKWKYIEIKHWAHGYHWNTDEPLKLIPWMKYKTWVWVKTNLTGSSDHWAQIRILTHDKDWNARGEYSLTPYIKTTTDWTFYEWSFTAPANAIQWHLEFRIYWHTGSRTLEGDAWRDLNSLYIVPVLNQDTKKIKYVSTSLEDNITDLNKAYETVVTEKAISDYLKTKKTKESWECSYATQEYYYYISEPTLLCNVWQASNLTKDDANKRYTWTCTGPDNGASVDCASKTCIPHNVTVNWITYDENYCDTDGIKMD